MMKLFGDIQSKGLLHAKGVLFLVVGVMACGGILLEAGSLRVLFLLVVGVWGFCRFYYYLFYVLERYAGRERKYAGLFDALRYIITRK
jgi:hypothetical protein